MNILLRLVRRPLSWLSWLTGVFLFLLSLVPVPAVLQPPAHRGPAPVNHATLQLENLWRFTRPLLAGLVFFGLLALVLPAAWDSAGVVGLLVVYLFISALGSSLLPLRPHRGRVYTATLTGPQILLDIIKAFRVWFPALPMIGTEFRGTPLKLNQSYTAHIATLPTAGVYDATNGYAGSSPNSIRGLLADVPIVVDQQPICPLKWLHLDQLKDIKNKWDECMNLAGYVIAKAAADAGVFAKCTTRYFSQEIVTSVANCDYDVLLSIGTALNIRGCLPTGRVLFVNSAVAEVIAADIRIINSQYRPAGQILDGNGYRQWVNVGGFALIQEYPGLSANNNTALTTVTATAATDLLTKAAHLIETGDPVVVTVIAGGAAGLAINTRYWAIKVSSSTFKLATTYANAVAGTAIDITSDSSSTHLTLSLFEGLIGFAMDRRAFGFLAGLPEGMLQDYADVLGIPKNTVFDTVVDNNSGMPMGAAKWQVPGTADFFWVPSFVYGTNAGKQGATAVAGNTAAANAILAAAQLAGAATDYAGLRITTGV